MEINVVIPMAGEGSRFSASGYQKPKPFIDVLGKPMIVRVLDNLNFNQVKFILVARQEHLEVEKELVAEIQNNYNVVFKPINHLTEGATCTVLHCREFINNSNPLIIANSDQIIDASFENFVTDCIDRNLDGSIMTFKDPEKSNKWSFAKLDSNGLVREVREKVPISDIATVGIYMFNKGLDFVNSAIDMIVQNDRVNNEFYVCPVYNYSIKSNLKIGVYDINFNSMHGIGTPEDLDNYMKILKEKLWN